MMTWTRAPTRLGTFLVAVRDGAVVRTALPGTDPGQFLDDLSRDHPGEPIREARDATTDEACRQLREWADGGRRDFDIRLVPHGTPFQEAVWKALQDIPYGETRSYGDVARMVQKPGAARAVGQANNRNPVAPFVPCHRVVAADGSLGGYGGGESLKEAMLALERRGPR